MTLSVPDLISEPLAQEFEALFRAHYQMVYRTAYRVTGSTEDAEDVLQTLFLRILHRGSPDLEKNPNGYLYRAAVNLSLNVVKSRRRHVLTDDLDSLESPAAATPKAEDEMSRRLSRALSKLSPRAVELLVLRYEHDYSDAEIAKMLGKSRGAIALTLFRARAHLKKLLRASDSGGEKKHETT